MLILMIVTILSFFALILVAMKFDNVYHIRKSGWKKWLAGMLACLTLFLLLFGTMLLSDLVTSYGADTVAIVCSENEYLNNETLFFDKENGKYFVEKENLWNMFKPTYRLYLNKEAAEKYVETYNALRAIELHE